MDACAAPRLQGKVMAAGPGTYRQNAAAFRGSITCRHVTPKVIRAPRIAMFLATPENEHQARGHLTILWFVLLAINVAVVLGTFLLGGFGGLREANTQTALLKAFDAVFFVFAPNVTAIFTYWFALK